MRKSINRPLECLLVIVKAFERLQVFLIIPLASQSNLKQKEMSILLFIIHRQYQNQTHILELMEYPQLLLF
jgi:hypothetical protein